VRGERANKGGDQKSKSQRMILIALPKLDLVIIKHVVKSKMSRAFIGLCVNVDGSVLHWCFCRDRNNANDNAISV
jgi:hypothetical protein